MKHVCYLTLGLILYGIVIALSRSSRSQETACAAPIPAQPVAQVAPVNLFPACGHKPEEKTAYTEALNQRQHELALMGEHRALRARSAEKLVATRKEAQAAAQSSWAALLKKSKGKFEALRQEAARQPNGKTPCTICDGMSNLACVMCDHRDGRCLSCHGSGRHNTELCPSCAGSGKCYLCAGSGQMLCPFCDDGTLHANGPLPSEKPPIQ